jgi:hypothetical protein
MGVDVQPRHPGSNPRGCEFGFLLFIKKTHCGGLPHRFPFKNTISSPFATDPYIIHKTFNRENAKEDRIHITTKVSLIWTSGYSDDDWTKGF